MLIDNITIRVRAGNGGDGTVAFNTNLMSRGPTGADGGHGGSVYFEGVSDLNALSQFSNKKFRMNYVPQWHHVLHPRLYKVVIHKIERYKQ